MSPLPAGQSILTLTDATGTPVLVVTEKWDPATGNFTVNPSVQAVNSTGTNQVVTITGSNGVVHPVTVPVGTTNVTPTQMAAVGLTNNSQLDGISIALA